MQLGQEGAKKGLTPAEKNNVCGSIPAREAFYFDIFH